MTKRPHYAEIADAMAEDATRLLQPTINVNRPPHDAEFYDTLVQRNRKSDTEARAEAGRRIARRYRELAEQDKYDNPYQLTGPARMLGWLIIAALIVTLVLGAFAIARKVTQANVAYLIECPTPRC